MENKKIKKYPIKKLIEIFDLKITNSDSANLDKYITSASIHRLGLELAESRKRDQKENNVISWGTKESIWIDSLSKEKALNSLRSVLDEYTPLIVLSKNVSTSARKLIIQVASEYKVPVAATTEHSSTIRATLGADMIKFFAKETSVHGSLVIINGVGVMIIGKSGVGKSEAVLELIQKNHSFVSDDTIFLKQIGRSFFGCAAPLTKGLLEARGIGIINIPYIYGQRLFKEEANVELVVELMFQKEIQNVDRLGNKRLLYKVMGGEIPLIQIPVNEGRSVSALIEAATNVFLARKKGLDPLKDITKRIEKEAKDEW